MLAPPLVMLYICRLHLLDILPMDRVLIYYRLAFLCSPTLAAQPPLFVEPGESICSFIDLLA
jgi:hypothetical protein